MIIVFFACGITFGQVTDGNKEVDNDNVASLNQIRSSLDDVSEKQKKVIAELESTQDPDHKKSLQQTLNRLDQQKRNFEKIFEKKALGGLNVDIADVPENEEQEISQYNIEKEMVKIIEPVFSSLQSLTESQRKRDFIRSAKTELEGNINAINDALAYLNNIDESKLSQSSIEHINRIKNSWEIELSYYTNQLELINIQYYDVESGGLFKRILNSIWEFVTHTGKILVVSLVVFIGLLYVFSRGLRKLASNHNKLTQRTKKRNLTWRIFLLSYEIMSFLIAFSVLLVIIHSSGDMALFGFAILILFAVILSLRNSIPAYFNRLKTFLNMGLAKEGERVIYKGLPWEIESIGLYSVYLVNPLLENGRIHLTIDSLEGMVSRDTKIDEDFFPTIKGDFVLIHDMYAQVISQTPDIVNVSKGGSLIEYSSEAFISANPINLSKGYVAATQFILDGSHAKDDVQALAKILLSTAQSEINQNADLKQLINVIDAYYVEMNIYGDLVFGLHAVVKENAPQYYFVIPRILQRSGLIAAMKNNWQLPNKSMVVAR